MRRRPSASTTDDDDDNTLESNASSPLPVPSPPLTRSKSKQYLDPNPHSKKTRIKTSRLADSSPQGWQSSRMQSPLDAKQNLHLPLVGQKSSSSDQSQSENMVKRMRFRNPWAPSWLTLVTLIASSVLLLGLYRSFTLLQLDPKGGSMSYMASSFVRFGDFDTEHTHFATKYALHLYREQGVDEDPRVRALSFE
jgi:glycosylphosphatidylinositol deacylase